MPFDLLQAIDQRLQFLRVADKLHHRDPLATALPKVAQVYVEVGHTSAGVAGGGLYVGHNAPLDVRNVGEVVAQLQLPENQVLAIVLEDTGQLVDCHAVDGEVLQLLAQRKAIPAMLGRHSVQSDYPILALLRTGGI